MKLKIAAWKTTLTFIFASLFCALMIFLVCILIFLDWPWDYRQPTIIVVWFISSIIFYIITLKSCYYVLSKKDLTVVRFKKRLVYSFSDIIYIDEELSKKKKMICFYTRFNHKRFVTFDKNNVVFPAMLKYCKNRMSKEEFEINYPNVKF